MITVSMTHQRDEGDHVVINSIPVWRDMLLTMVCWHNPRWTWDYRLWSWALQVLDKRRDLYRIPVLPPQACAISRAMWGEETHQCFWEGCPVEGSILAAFNEAD